MKIFISWSGTPAHEMAKFLQVWLVKVIQALEPFVSSSIESGARWDAAIAGQLETTVEGIVIVTSRNQSEPWLNFEAGALAKATDISRVRPLLIDLSPTDVQGPISSFQATRAGDKTSVLKMLREINARCQRPLDDTILEQTFEREWLSFEEQLQTVIELEKASGADRPPERETPEILSEILQRVRAIEREAVEQRFQIAAFVPSLDRRMWTDAEIADFEERHTSELGERQRLRAAENEVTEIARNLVGATVIADDPTGGRITGEVMGALTRGTGVYVRIAPFDGGKQRTVAVRDVTLAPKNDPKGSP